MGTLPKVIAAGLVRNVAEDVVSEFGEVELLLALVTLALVTPEQPDWIKAANKIVANTRRAATGGTVPLYGGIGTCRRH